MERIIGGGRKKKQTGEGAKAEDIEVAEGTHSAEGREWMVDRDGIH